LSRGGLLLSSPRKKKKKGKKKKTEVEVRPGRKFAFDSFFVSHLPFKYLQRKEKQQARVSGTRGRFLVSTYKPTLGESS